MLHCPMGRNSFLIGLCLSCLAASLEVDAARVFNGANLISTSSSAVSEVNSAADHHGKQFITPGNVKNLFIQERASKQLPGPGQHFRFGALKDWELIHAAIPPGGKLVLLVRHGQAISNWLSDTLGPDIWYSVEETCSYKLNETKYEIFDAALTNLGQEQATALNSMLDGGGWFDKLTAGKPARVVLSPLTRCVQTTDLVMGSLKSRITGFNVEEDIRETLGEDTCDARRSASDPPAKEDEDANGNKGPCKFTDGLRTTFPSFQFPIRSYSCQKDNSVCRADGFGLSSDTDQMWTEKRESQRKQVIRATRFLNTLFDNAPEEVVFVVTHSGFTRSVLLAVGREPYRPQNTELVPAIIVPGKLPADTLAAWESLLDGPGWSDDDDFQEGRTKK